MGSGKMKRGGKMADDAVGVVRSVLERRMSGEPCFREEVDSISSQLRVLKEREIRVRSLGGAFGRVEMSPYVLEMLEEVVTGQPA